MNNTSMTIRTDKEIKHKAQQIFSELGMDMSTAVNIFLRQTIRLNGMPFAVTLDTPNRETIAAFEEGEKMLHAPEAPRFSSVDELFAELDS